MKIIRKCLKLGDDIHIGDVILHFHRIKNNEVYFVIHADNNIPILNDEDAEAAAIRHYIDNIINNN